MKERNVLMMVGVLMAVVVCAGCAILERVVYPNEAVRFFHKSRDIGTCGGESVICIEQITVSTDNALKVSDVYVNSSAFLQTYRTEGCKVFDYHCSGHLDNPCGEDERNAYSEKIIAVWKKQAQYDTSPKQLTGDSFTKVTQMSWSVSSEPTWSHWATWQWIGTPEEVPAEIETLRHYTEQVVTVPKHAKKYRFYLRAVPLFTEEELEAEKDTRLIDRKKLRAHARLAIEHPYLLVPVPRGGSPFTSARKYTYGNKFKVRAGYNNEAYYLIETFTGEVL